MIQIAPSLLSADFWNLEHDVQTVTEAGAEVLHIDVMDGHFVPNITMGPMIVKALSSKTDAILDTHLMISDPDAYIQSFAEVGSHWISFHLETTRHPHRTVQTIQQLGCLAGIAINPGTPVHALEELIHDIDFVLLMSVNPGFGGQNFIERTYERLEQLGRLIQKTQNKPFIEVDGGVGLNNIHKLANLGVRVFVAGSSVYKTPEPSQAVRELLQKAGEIK